MVLLPLPRCCVVSKENYFPSQASIAGWYFPVFNTMRYVQQTSLDPTLDPNAGELSLACSPGSHLVMFWASPAASSFHTWCQYQLHPVVTYECLCAKRSSGSYPLLAFTNMDFPAPGDLLALYCPTCSGGNCEDWSGLFQPSQAAARSCCWLSVQSVPSGGVRCTAPSRPGNRELLDDNSCACHKVSWPEKFFRWLTFPTAGMASGK